MAQCEIVVDLVIFEISLPKSSGSTHSMFLAVVADRDARIVAFAGLGDTNDLSNLLGNWAFHLSFSRQKLTPYLIGPKRCRLSTELWEINIVFCGCGTHPFAQSIPLPASAPPPFSAA